MCKVTTGWLLIKGTRNSNSLTFTCLFVFFKDHIHQQHTGTRRAHVSSRMQPHTTLNTGSVVVKTCAFIAMVLGLIPGRGTKIPQAATCS